MPCLVLGMLGRLDEALALAEEAAERQHELSGNYGDVDWVMAAVATLAGDEEKAVCHLQRFCDLLEGKRRSRPFPPSSGLSLCALGRYDEAEPLARKGRELGHEHDVYTQVLWRQVQALVHAHRGDHAEAEALAREAVSIGERTDALNLPALARDPLLSLSLSPWRPRAPRPKEKPCGCRASLFGPARIRTWDQRIMSPLL